MTVLVLGAGGQVGSHLGALLPSATCWDRDVADFRDSARLTVRVQNLAPSLIVNAAAYTAVDKAESEPEAAWAVNAEGPATLARVARMLDIPLIHISTDYVFDGEQSRPYRETDPTCPINVYGRTKLAGELAVASMCPRHWILRTSWVFSEFSVNFVKTMLRLAAERDELGIVADQHGQPTYAGDLARLIAAIVDAETEDRPPFGLYHVAGGEETTWHGFAQAIVDGAYRAGLIEQRPVINAITTEQYPTPARRPRYSVMAMNEDLARSTGCRPNWQHGLDRTLEGLSRAAIPKVESSRN